ncbi:unnamed protein product, partial [Closterium sp. NIES-53]
MGPPRFNHRMASASLVSVGFLPVVRPGRASIFSPSRAPGVRRFCARRAPRAHNGLLLIVRPAVARAAPAPPPPPPLLLRPPADRAAGGGGYGGGGGGERRFPARHSPYCRPRGSYTPPPSPSSPFPCFACSSGGEGMGVAGVSSQPPTTSSSLSLPHLSLCREKGGSLEVKGVAGRDLQHQPPPPPLLLHPPAAGAAVGGRGSAAPAPPRPLLLHPTAAGAAMGGRVWGWRVGVDAVKPAAPVACEIVAPVAREPVAPVARESVAPAARLAAEPITPVARVPVAPFANVPVAPVARVLAASAATHHLLSSHGPSSSSLALSFLRCAWCTPSGGVLHMVLHCRQLG